MKARCLSNLQLDFVGARVEAELALQFNPQLAPARISVAVADCHLGDLEQGLETLRPLVEACSRGPHRHNEGRELAVCLLMAGRDQEAADVMRRNTADSPHLTWNQLIFAATLVLIGESTAAQRLIADLLSEFPTLSVKTMRPIPTGDTATVERFSAALVQAGLPED